jgi:oxygen-independent coproporphyrinogen-3 oxidase
MLAYIHIPYCDSKCHYCAFNSYVGRFDTRTDYMAALHRQLAHELERFSAMPGSIETLFIGGGTPSTVSPELYAPIFGLLAPYLADGAEITTEANPNSATEAWLSGMHDLGVNRVSFGVQSFDEKKLKRLGRAHTPGQAEAAILAAHALGIPHGSLDLIYNVTGDTEEAIHYDIEKAFSLPIDHLSAYELTIENNTPFAATPDVRQSNDDLAFFVAREITRRGFEHYEISSFGRHRSRHNLGYWQLKSYIGAGAGAVGFHEHSRYYPPTDIQAYITDPLAIRIESLSDRDLQTERIFLGLRSELGIAKNILSPRQNERAQVLVQEGKLSQEGAWYHNPNLFVADEVALFLLG